MLTLKLPDGSGREVAPKAPGPARWPSPSANVLPRPPSPPRSTATIVDLDRELPADGWRAVLPDSHRQGPRSAGRAASQHRPHHGPRRHAAVPRRAARLRPAAGKWLLLRHRFADADPRGGFSPHRGGDAQDRRRGRAVRALRAPDRRGPRTGARPGPALQGRTHRRRPEAVSER